MTSTEIGGNSELVGIIVAFVVLLITFGSVIAAGLPIISALIGLASGVGIISLLTYAFDIPNVTLTLAVMIDSSWYRLCFVYFIQIPTSYEN